MIVEIILERSVVIFMRSGKIMIKNNKLPGKAYRIVSFIPGINFASLLYIGFVNKRIGDIICALIYAALTYAFIDASPMFWLAGAVHYAFSYRNVKRQALLYEKVKGPGTKPAPHFQQHTESLDVQKFSEASVSSEAEQRQAVPAHGDIKAKGTNALFEPHTENRDVQKFSEISIPGEAEQRQAIPARAYDKQEGANALFSQCSYMFNFDNPRKKFFDDMRKYAEKEGRKAAFVPFMTYWPTYDSMNKEQSAWYFYWRSKVRSGSFPDTDLSYIFLYVYEILSGTGWSTPQEGYDLLLMVWQKYSDRFPKLDNYLFDWSFDFAQLNGLRHDIYFDDYNMQLKPSPRTDLLIERYADSVPLKLPFALISALCDYSIAHSKFYKDGNQDLIREALTRVISLADASLRKKTKAGILNTYGPRNPKKQAYSLFRSAVCPPADKEFSFTVKEYSSCQELRAYVNELVRYGENALREIKGYRGRLRGVTLEEDMSKLIKTFLTKEYGQAIKKTGGKGQNTGVKLDFNNITIIRKESDAVREALSLEGIPAASEKELLTDLKEAEALYKNLTSEARNFLGGFEALGWEVSATAENELLMAEINRAAKRNLGCQLLVKEDSVIILEDDYRDEIEHIYVCPPESAEAEGIDGGFDVDALPAELRELIEFLLPEQRKALCAVLMFENSQNELERIAEEAMTMPQILIDDINQVALQTLGGVIVDLTGQDYYVLDEYASVLKRSVREDTHAIR